MRVRTILGHSAQALAEGALIALLVAGLAAGTTFAAKGGGGGSAGGGAHHGGGGAGCVVNAPGVAVQNTWAWGSWGSYGLPGQRLGYLVTVLNNDTGCGSSSFVMSLSAPSGFSVSIPTNSISLKSSSTGYLWAYVTSPTSAADGDYSLAVAVVRSGTTAQTASTSTYYKVYSSDFTAPTLFWPSPGEGQTISGTYNVVVSSSDDHEVSRIELLIDGSYKSTTTCDDVSYTCQLNYSWSGAVGPHAATFKSYDWMGNAGQLTTSFTVN
jgi:Bacterial Ig domain